MKTFEQTVQAYGADNFTISEIESFHQAQIVGTADYLIANMAEVIQDMMDGKPGANIRAQQAVKFATDYKAERDADKAVDHYEIYSAAQMGVERA